MLTLIIPIGPPGSGKTTLSQELLSTDLNFHLSSRDELYAEIKKTNSSRKTRKILFDRMISFFNRIIEIPKSENPVVYMDSCNAKKAIRDKFLEKLNPDKIIYLNFRYLDLEFLLERTQARGYHPTFPEETENQINIIKGIMSGIEYEKDLGKNVKIINENVKIINENVKIINLDETMSINLKKLLYNEITNEINQQKNISLI